MTTDLLLLNGKIWTGAPRQPWAEALAVSGGVITAIGSNVEVATKKQAHTKTLDLGGKTVLPGFIDNHTHFMTGGFQLLSVNLRGSATPGDFARRIADKVKNLPKQRWLTGGGWNHELWAPARLPAKELIDRVTPRNPVFVTRLDLHMGLANSYALKLAKIDRDTPNPPGGQIERNPVTGEPTGILKDAAMDLVTSVIPAPSNQEYEDALNAAMHHAASFGITSIQDITSWPEWEAYRRLHQAGRLTVRIYARTPIPAWEKQLDILMQQGNGDQWLRLGGVKGFIDGALGSGTALMFDPFDDEPENSGLLFDQMLPEGIMQERAQAANQAGLPVSIHAIGDKANHLLLQMYREIAAQPGSSLRGLRIEHAQHIRPDDIKAIGALGLAVSMQPVHLLDDGHWAERRIGPARAQTTLACRSFIDAGAKVSFGTDWPVAPLNPLLGIYAATTRNVDKNRFPEGWIPPQKISLTEAVQAYTLGSAYAEFAEHYKGSLEPGKLADMAVLSQDIFTIDPDAIPATEILYTFVNGSIVYQSPT